ncbi:hypothetical protein GE21DRAFT_1059541 [Neurospora crassa]|nr:hypothetical protein GE21DRAFT_1059541 [Neurospora crassa]
MTGTTWPSKPLIRTLHRISRYGNCTGMIGAFTSANGPDDFRDARLKFGQGPVPNPVPKIPRPLAGINAQNEIVRNKGIEIHQRYMYCPRRDHGDDLPLCTHFPSHLPVRQRSPAAIHRCKYFPLFPAVKNELGRNNGCVCSSSFRFPGQAEEEEEEEEEEVPC